MRFELINDLENQRFGTPEIDLIGLVSIYKEVKFLILLSVKLGNQRERISSG